MAINYIEKQKELESLTNDLQQKTEIAIDLEFDRNRYRYGFNMCLMQIYDGNNCYLVDPLSNDLDINTIFPAIENPAIQKVVFAFGEDLRLFHSMGCFPKNLYDLDIATSLLNFQPTSLTNFIEEVLGIVVNSSSQQSNWYRRPLSDQQKEYAADDVLYLLDFKEALEKLASEKGLSNWIEQENAVFNHLDYSDEDHNILIKDKDKNDMSMFEWFVYCELMKFFDEVAQRYNKPVYQLVSKKIVQDLAQNPHKVHQWEDTRGVFNQIKTADFRAQLQSTLDISINEAESRELSKSKKATETMTKSEYHAMRKEQHRINNLKNKLLSPIQDRLIHDYGKHAKAFILPNRLTKEIITGNTELMPDYKLKLFRKYADEMDIDLSEFL